MTKEKLLLQIQHIESLCGLSRQGKIFYTKDHSYFFDAGTAKVFECQGKELDLLKLLLSKPFNLDNIADKINDHSYYEAIENLFTLINDEHILQMPYYKEIDTDDINLNGEDHKIEHIILELTQKCNLRCRYCVYNETYDDFRTFTTDDMDWETAKKALDYAYQHSNESVAIGFYGGEPLINYPLMKQCIDYCEHNFINRRLSYAFTSNLTLLTPAMAEYFAKLTEMQITCSMDGPQELHDENRVGQNHIGSYMDTLRGLRLLISAFGEERSVKHISIHSVICPPVTHERYKLFTNIFDTLDWLPNDIDKSYSYVAKGSLPGYEHKINDQLNGLDALLDIDPMRYYALIDLITSEDFTKTSFKLLRKNLIKIHTMELYDEPQQIFYRNACCVPGKRKIYITTAGDFKVCERLGQVPYIGNIKDGIHIHTLMNKYIDEYDSYALKKCNACWSIHICPMCYAYCYGNNGLDQKKKDDFCKDYKTIGMVDLIIYYYLLEKIPAIQDLLDELSEL